jgi:hypothetical protein
MKADLLYRSSNLKVFRNGPWSQSRDTLVVCFQYRQPSQQLDLPGFAEEFFAKSEIDAVFVNCASNEWYQYQDLPLALSKIRTFASTWRRVVTYGSSMGAYAALRFAAAIGAQASISIGPQYSPRPTVIAGEHRFCTDIAVTGFLHEESYQANSCVANYVIYDPLLKLDSRHVVEYQKTATLILIAIPCGGHTPTILLVQCGMLSDFILQLVAGTFSVQRFRRQFRLARRSSPEYWKELGERLHEHGRPEAARRVSQISADS